MSCPPWISSAWIRAPERHSDSCATFTGRMNQPLSHNGAHLASLCRLLELGDPGGEVLPVAGGFHHRMWQVHTDRGRFAVKQLGEDVLLDDPRVHTRFNACEKTAASFNALGIPALAALERDGHYLQVLDATGYLVYPWTSGRACARNAIDEQHIDTVADILARMHAADIQVPELGRELPNLVTAEWVTELVHMGIARNVHGADLLQARLDDILSVVASLHSAIPQLLETRVISHGDLDHKNVLWTGDHAALLIDWESAMHINPTYETLLEALDWSGITANFETRPFERFLSAYVAAGGALDEHSIPPAFTTILGAWVNWMMYNVGRAVGIEDTRQRAIGSEQVDLALGTLLRLERQIPRLRDIALRHAG